MAATAAAAMSSSFSPSIHTTLKCTRSNYHLAPHYDLLHLRIITSPTRMLSSSSSLFAHSCVVDQPVVSRRVLRLSCASVDVAVTEEVEEEEVEAIVAAEEKQAEEEEEVVVPPTSAEVSSEAGVSNDDELAVNTKLYFGNLPYSVDSAQLAGIIQEYASPELIEVLYNRDTGKSRGFAFVTMSSIEDCNAVIENLDGREYSGRTLRVNFSDKPRAKEPLYPETEYKLFVGNLSWSATSESLTKAFQEYGNVVGARVLYDGETGRSRGYGFVCFSTKAEMETALQSLDGVELEGRAMRVSLAEGKRS
ncbi:31 kDa ribonucleoprotein, chloroplastic-like [Argentina anserina]|uniref:31 kDa ribonucleoprotein, chloroplastic-like n=1 Tax=Argentina anserina TaxID=57926 RepID=UPI0021766095|nr:31 kDa ribonucleoprotein, chloroplastic-like [Potentilla anserina]